LRLVSLVPSLTETLHEFGVDESILGVTKFCIHPETARDTAAVVGGTKDPDVLQVLSLRPDLVLADEDENKPEHIEELRAAGVTVHVTRIETVNDVARELRTIGQLVGRAHEAEKFAADLQELAAQTRENAKLVAPVSCFVPVWKRPLMSMGGRTYMADLLRIAGAKNVFDDAQKKYFETDADEVRTRQPDAILLPTEPYRFRESDRGFFVERFDVPLDAVRVVDGEAFTWFGTRSLDGIRVLAECVAQLRAAALPKP
jgi:ABC-type Fe3+-hydroxamate transport system substrate-binding protein